MARINLLPWREERRRELNKSFYITTGFLGVLGLSLVFAVNLQIDAQVSAQKKRNNFIVNEQKALEQKIVEINELKNERAQLESRMKIIQDLQGNRSVVVRLFDEIAKNTPDGVHLRKIDRVSNKFKIEGVAEANNRISNFMRNLDQSSWFKNPNLTSVVSDDDKESNIFVLTVEEELKKLTKSET